MEEKITQLVQYLKKLFWGTFLTSSLAGILSVLIIPQIYKDTQIGEILRTVAILILLICIPLALKLYYKKLKENSTENDMRKWFTVRLILIAITFLFNIVVYALTRDISSVFCSLIAFMALFLCKPNKAEITQLLSKN